MRKKKKAEIMGSRRLFVVERERVLGKRMAAFRPSNQMLCHAA